MNLWMNLYPADQSPTRLAIASTMQPTLDQDRIRSMVITPTGQHSDQPGHITHPNICINIGMMTGLIPTNIGLELVITSPSQHWHQGLGKTPPSQHWSHWSRLAITPAVQQWNQPGHITNPASHPPTHLPINIGIMAGCKTYHQHWINVPTVGLPWPYPTILYWDHGWS